MSKTKLKPKSKVFYKHIVIVAVLLLIMLFQQHFKDTKQEREQIPLIVKKESSEISLTKGVRPLKMESLANEKSPRAPVAFQPLEHIPGFDSVIVDDKDKDNAKKSLVNNLQGQENQNIENSLETDSTAHAPVATLPVSGARANDILIIDDGDTLSDIFDRLAIGQSVMYKILNADESFLALETLQPGHVLYFRYDENSELREMELYRRLGDRIIYHRNIDGIFDYKHILQEGEWRNELITGAIDGAFYLSVQSAGLTKAEAVTITQIFQEQIDFTRSIRKGDRFQIVRSAQYIGEHPTGESRIESARIQRRKREHTAFMFDDGRYYDKNGKSLTRAFRRLPLRKRYRISSAFNPRRVHPVTGRVRPHNGTDFATPTGTPVLSIGDGVVTRVSRHPFAGRYVEIKHNAKYKTRYLHLKRSLVRRGQTVSRGEKIALSGNTGRSTGPHLHFELHINGRPVDPMKAKIPVVKSIPKKHRQSFKRIVSEQTRLLDTQRQISSQAITVEKQQSSVN